MTLRRFWSPAAGLALAPWRRRCGRVATADRERLGTVRWLPSRTLRTSRSAWRPQANPAGGANRRIGAVERVLALTASCASIRSSSMHPTAGAARIQLEREGRKRVLLGYLVSGRCRSSCATSSSSEPCSNGQWTRREPGERPVLDSSRRKSLEREAMARGRGRSTQCEALARAAGVKLAASAAERLRLGPADAMYRQQAMMPTRPGAGGNLQSGEMKFTANVNAEYDLVVGP